MVSTPIPGLWVPTAMRLVLAFLAQIVLGLYEHFNINFQEVPVR